MDNDTPDETELRKVFSDVVNGYSYIEYEGEPAFVKHFGSKEQQQLEWHYETIFKKAKNNGLPTEKEAMEFLKEENLWTEQDEGEYIENQKYIENLEETKKNLIIPGQIKDIEEDIKKNQQELALKQSKRDSLITETCETYARNKSNDYSIYISFYKNKECTKKLFDKDEFEELTKHEISQWFECYMKESSHLNVENIKYLSVSNIFSMYYNIMGPNNIYKIIPRPIYDFSFYQLNLLNYAKILHSIIENYNKIPEKIKKHPDRLLAYAESKSKNQAIVDKGKNKQGFSVMGASKQDMGEMGVSDELALSPFQLAKEKGSLTIEDFQKFS